MRTFFHLAVAVALFAAAIASESHSSDLLRISEDGWYTWQVAGDERLEIYARIESGRPVEMRIPSFECNHRRGLPDDARDLGPIAADESIAWLLRFVSPRSDVSSGVMAAIAAHDSAEAARALVDVVRSDRHRKNRSEAVFWLANTDDDAAFLFLDELLTAPN